MPSLPLTSQSASVSIFGGGVWCALLGAGQSLPGNYTRVDMNDSWMPRRYEIKFIIHTINHKMIPQG